MNPEYRGLIPYNHPIFDHKKHHPHTICVEARPTGMNHDEKGNRLGLELPQEMNDHIMNFLQHNTKSLKSCRLVCKSWSIAARPYLFSTLVVEDKNSRVVFTIPAVSSPYFGLMRYVKCVELRNTEHILAVRSPASILSSLSSTLTRMHLLKCCFDTFSELTDVIRAFPCLEDLSLDCVDWKVSQGQHTSHSDDWSPSSLKSLRLRNLRITIFMHWIFSFEKPLTLSRFEAGPVNEDDLPAVTRICATNSATLQYLRASFEEDGITGSYIPCNAAWGPGITLNSPIAKLYSSTFLIPNYRTLAVFRILESLRIDRFLDSSKTDQSQGVFWTPRIISKIDPPHLFKYLTLELAISRTGELDQYGHRWDFFDEALGGDFFPNFQYLEFEVVGKVDLDAVASLLSHHLPRLVSRGRLRFSKPS